MRYKALPFSVFTAATLVATPAMAQVEPPVDAVGDEPITDIGVGDANVRLETTTTSPVMPGIDAWVHLMWLGDTKLDAREFKVTAEGSAGVEVGYPYGYQDEKRDFTSLFHTDVLAAGGYDFTALRLVVDKEAVDPRLKVTLSYVSDTGPVTETFEVIVAIDENEFEDDALELANGTLGSVHAGEIAWFDVEMKALHNAANVAVRVVEPNGFGIVYPNDLDHSKLAGGARIVVGEKDHAAVRFDTNDLEPGEYEVVIEVTYDVGFTTLTQEVTRTIMVTDSDTDDTDADDTDADDTDTDDTDTDDTGNGDTDTDDTGNGGSDDDDSDDDDSDDSDSNDSNSNDSESGSGDDGETGTVTVTTLADGIGEWTVDPYGTDDAITGVWGFGQPLEATWSGVTVELGSTPSGNPGLFTLSGTGDLVGDHDLDGGESSILSPTFALPDADHIRLDFSHYFSYLRNATSDDSLMILMIVEDGDNKVIHYEQAKSSKDKKAEWKSKQVDLSAYAGQNVSFLIVAGDRGTPSYVEAAIDGFTITAE